MFLATNHDSSLPGDAPEHLLRFLEFLLRGQSYSLPGDYLRRRLESGGCLLLLDGLDEVPGLARARVTAIVEKLVIQHRNRNRHLLTCRTRAYQGDRRLGTVPSFRLAAFEPAQVAERVKASSRALFRVPPHDGDGVAAGQAEAYRQQLQEAIDAHPDVGPLTESPLMLTLLAVVHWNRRKLPEQRAEFYDAAIEYLLEARREQSAFPLALRREALQALALAMVEDPEGVQRSLGQSAAAVAVAPVLGVELPAAEEFVDDEALCSGLLVSRTEGEIEFWHLSFEEHLAASQLVALQLATGEDYWSRIERHLHDDRWSEVLLLLASSLHRRGGARASKRLVEKILATGTDPASRARAVGLVGRLLRDLRPYGGDPAAGTAYEAALTETLALFEPDGQAAPEAVRVEVGEALGLAGDPRLLDSFAHRVAFAGGRFRMGAQKDDRGAPNHDPEAFGDEAPVHWVTVSPFTMGRYPVTVGEFRRFLEAKEKGYLNPRLWSPEGWAWRANEEVPAPGSWEQPGPASEPPGGGGFLARGRGVLPLGGRSPAHRGGVGSLAARGLAGRRYPWGESEPGEEQANFQMRVASPSPVGIYPRGATPEGLYDLAGNVWEWCRDWYGPYPVEAQTDPPGPPGGAARVLRGGSFDVSPSSLRGAFRFNYLLPGFRGGVVGFRVVWSRSSGLEGP